MNTEQILGENSEKIIRNFIDNNPSIPKATRLFIAHCVTHAPLLADALDDALNGDSDNDTIQNAAAILAEWRAR